MNRRRQVTGLLLVGLGALWMARPDATPSPAGESPETLRAELPTRTSHVAEHGSSAPEQAARAAVVVGPSVLLQDLEGLDPEATWVPNQLLVSGTHSELLVELAEAHGLQVALGRSVDSVAVLRAPKGTELRQLRATIHATPGVGAVARHGVVRGATTDGTTSASLSYDKSFLQWHLDAVEVGLHRTRGVGVAVLDSGVAFRAARVNSPQLGWIATAPAPSLSHTRKVDPWDFVDGDPYPDDEHWHGTHIASTIAGWGTTYGTGTGSGILPYRVLDANNVGLEFFLIDALGSAVRAGARVVNMSLSFGPDYVPSEALQERLEAVAGANVLMVGAAGNNADVGSTWPAASRHVISVGSVCAVGDLQLAPYSNHGGDVDIYAPGGCNDRDEDNNGFPDGILGEAFPENTPHQVAPYWVQGTSQAAAVVTGIIARALSAGMHPDKILGAMELGGEAFDDGAGGGVSLSVPGLIQARASYPGPPPAYRVAMLPWIEELGDELVPRLNVLVLDEAGAAVDGVKVRGTFKGTTNKPFHCTTSLGVCSVAGKGESGTDAVGWTATVSRIETGGQKVAPTGVLLANGPLDAAYLDAWNALEDTPPLGFELLEDSIPGAAHAYSFPLMGSGISTSPFGVVVTESFLDELGAPIDHGMGGSGLSTSPFGWTGIGLPGEGLEPQLVTVEGSGISTSPFGVLLKGTESPPTCLGLADCAVSVVDPVDESVAGELGGSSASLKMLVMGGEEAALAGSSTLFEGMGAPKKLKGQSDMAVPLVTE